MSSAHSNPFAKNNDSLPVGNPEDEVFLAIATSCSQLDEFQARRVWFTGLSCRCHVKAWENHLSYYNNH